MPQFGDRWRSSTLRYEKSMRGLYYNMYNSLNGVLCGIPLQGPSLSRDVRCSYVSNLYQ